MRRTGRLGAGVGLNLHSELRIGGRVGGVGTHGQEGIFRGRDKGKS